MINRITAAFRRSATTSPVSPTPPSEDEDKCRKLAEQVQQHTEYLAAQRELIKRIIRALEDTHTTLSNEGVRAYEDACDAVGLVPRTHYQRTIGAE